MHNPIKVAMLQCGIVGVNFTSTLEASSSTTTPSNEATPSCSSVSGCSGSAMCLRRSLVNFRTENFESVDRFSLRFDLRNMFVLAFGRV
ncbi:hypothetical protein MHBO_003234 [Bonamia ostreae]|uniref:Secreted protein n=1 Tax=Bonamia ostreae TaxID=126728 RepID=A0ABV2AQE9_9EUKA